MNYFYCEIKRLYDIGEIFPYPLQEMSKIYKAYGNSKYYLVFMNDFVEEHLDILNRMYNKEKAINNRITLNSFSRKIINNIRQYKSSSIPFNEEVIKTILDEIYLLEIKEYSIFYEVYGISLINKEKIFCVSKFNIYYWPITKKIIEDKYEDSKRFFGYKNHDYLIETTIETATEERAIELAATQFEKWQYCMHVLLGHKHRKYHISINHEKPVYTRQTFVTSKDGIFSNTSSENDTETINVDDLYFTNNEKYNAIWKLLSLKKPNDFEKRILLAIEWLGQAYQENSTQNSFIKAAISLEIIFTYHEKAIITPSILYQISESIAMILGENVNTCLKIEKEFKKLYEIRSSIVHAGNKEIEYSYLNDILNYSRNIILELLTNKKYSNIKSIDELYKLLKIKKYSSGNL